MLMENAAEALKIAGSMLMFIIALTVGIASFGQVRQAADSALYDLDEEMMYVDGEYYYTETATRQVGIETVIPTVSRVFNETYKVIFDFQDPNEEPIYTIKPTSGEETKKVYTLDKEANVLQGGLIGKEIFFRAILFGDTTTEFIDPSGINEESKRRNWTKLYDHNVKLPTQPLYERLKGKKIIESAGVYTDDELDDVPEANREKIRVITYTISNF